MSNKHRIYRIEGVLFDPHDRFFHGVEFGDKKSRELFALLIENYNRVVTKAQIMDYLWSDVNVGDNTPKLVNRIRNVLESSNLPLTIEAVSKVGYKLSGTADIIQVPDPNESELKTSILEYEHRRCANLNWLGLNVPMGKNYKLLPVLKTTISYSSQRTKNESEIPHDSEEFDSQQETVRQWSERQQVKNLFAHERFELKELFTEFVKIVKKTASLEPSEGEGQLTVPRFFLLGEPGAGKSTACKFLAWACGEQEDTISPDFADVLGRLAAPTTGVDLTPARIRLPLWEREKPDLSLPEYLTYLYRETNNPPETELWQFWLRQGEVLLLFDGLDETDGNITEKLQSAISDYSNCPTVISCRTASYGHYQAIAPDFPVFWLEGLNLGQIEEFVRAYAQVFNEQRGGKLDSDLIIKSIKEHKEVKAIASNPLLLALLCFAHADGESLDEHLTRSLLYDKAIKKLLSEENLTERQINELRNRQLPPALKSAEEKQIILERFALVNWLPSVGTPFTPSNGVHKTSFTHTELLTELTNALNNQGYDTADKILTGDFLSFLTRVSGILVGELDHNYFFLHLTIQEYLVGSALAREINRSGYHKAYVRVKKRKRKIKRILITSPVRKLRFRAKRLTIGDEMIFRFAVGQLNNPEGFLWNLFKRDREESAWGSITSGFFHDLRVQDLVETPGYYFEMGKRYNSFVILSGIIILIYIVAAILSWIVALFGIDLSEGNIGWLSLIISLLLIPPIGFCIKIFILSIELYRFFRTYLFITTLCLSELSEEQSKQPHVFEISRKIINKTFKFWINNFNQRYQTDFTYAIKQLMKGRFQAQVEELFLCLLRSKRVSQQRLALAAISELGDAPFSEAMRNEVSKFKDNLKI